MNCVIFSNCILTINTYPAIDVSLFILSRIFLFMFLLLSRIYTDFSFKVD